MVDIMGSYQTLSLAKVELATFPKGPCTHTAYTCALKYLNRDYFQASVYTI